LIGSDDDDDDDDDQRDDRDFAERGFASEMASRRRKSTVLEGEEEFEPSGRFPTTEATNERVGLEAAINA
jgi:hypothetical protein